MFGELARKRGGKEGKMKLRISKSYGQQKVFENFTLEIEEGKILCLLGESGGGKTTLLNILAGLTDYDGALEGVPQKVGYVFQEPRLLLNLSVEQNLRYAGGRVALTEEILRKTELWELRNKRPSALSGGEKQRVSIARAFLSEAELLLLDEPFSSLDTGLKIRLINVFTQLWQERKPTVVFVTHDLEEACMLGERIVAIRKGKIIADFTPREETIPRAYGQSVTEKAELLRILTS